MYALILAAGEGHRLGDDLGRRPKCLLQVGKRSLLQRRLLSLKTQGVHHSVIVTGYKAGAVRRQQQNFPAGGEYRLIHNARYQEGCMRSLLTGLEALDEWHGGVLLMDADVLHDERLLEPLLAPDLKANRCLFDSGFDGSREAVKLCLREGRAVEFRKRVAPTLRYDQCGESVGFFRLEETMAVALRERARAYLSSGRGEAPYEEALRELLLEFPEQFAYPDIRGLPWIEIDFPEDLRRAEQEILPRLLPSGRATGLNSKGPKQQGQ